MFETLSKLEVWNQKHCKLIWNFSGREDLKNRHKSESLCPENRLSIFSFEDLFQEACRVDF